MNMEAFKLFFENFIKREDFVIILGIIAAFIISYIFTKKVLICLLQKIARQTKTTWDDHLTESGALNNLAYIVPAIVLYYSAFLFPAISEPAGRIISVFIFFNIFLAINKLLGMLHKIYSQHSISRKYPIKSYIQLIQIFFIILCLILSISIILDQSPWLLISGLGAVTAVLLLIFKDTILSFLASLHIVMYDLVRMGDWIEMPKYDADGDVIDIALHTVKVQNWDKTITTIPTYKLIEDSFKNWRGMQESGGRRIKRHLLIDQKSVSFCDEEMVERFKKIQLLTPYINQKKEEIEVFNKEHNIDTSVLINGRRMTNLGTFRAYVTAYLKGNDLIRKDMTFLVRQLQPTPEGLPLEIYVFSRDTAWANYEAIQADIFDHLLAAVSFFDLRVFQRPSGYDLEIIKKDPISGVHADL